VGSKVAEHRGALLLSHPIDHGRVRDWPDMELLWRTAYESGAVGATASAHPLLLTQPPSASRSAREEAATVFFESLRVPALFLAPTTTLALYATGRTTGLVLECGDGVTAAAPIYEGFALPHALMRADFGGGDVTDALATLLRRSGAAFATTAERETVRSIKETAGSVAASAAAADAFAAVGAAADEDAFLLPDGSRLAVGSDVGRAFEVLFRPALAGLEAPGCADLVSCALARTDLDLRRALLGSVILTGGSTAARGFAARLLGDVRAAAPPDAHVRVWAPADRKLLPWIGGSILASLSTFRSTWVSREEWEEEGPRCLAKFG
jgi:centractin